MEKSKEQEKKEMEAAVAAKAKERAFREPRTTMVGWTDAELAALGDRLDQLESAVNALQAGGIRIRSAGTTEKRATVGILDRDGQWVPRDAATREWPTVLAALQGAGLTVAEDGELVAYVAPAAEAKPARRRSSGEG